MNRHMPIFLDLVNHKRQRQNEPIVSAKQVVASAFVVIDTSVISDNHTNHTQQYNYDTLIDSSVPTCTIQMEMAHAAELYVDLIKRIRSESSACIKHLLESTHLN